jgi:hypothetical protein
MKRLILSWPLLVVLGTALGEPPESPPRATDTASAATPAPAQALASAPNKRRASGRAETAHDRLELDTTSITGNRELPKVMVIVPWKKSDIGDLVGKPVNTLIDEALQPIDRDSFRREVSYHSTLAPDKGRSETQVTTAPPGADGKR